MSFVLALTHRAKVGLRKLDIEFQERVLDRLDYLADAADTEDLARRLDRSEVPTIKFADEIVEE